jgi:GT2 family glycosyltransferase
LLNFTVYPDFEVFVVDNSSRGRATLEYLRLNGDLVTVIRDERPFNFAALNNDAVRQTTGDVICLLNDDTEVIEEDWLTEMVSQLAQPGVGAVGGKLHYPDGRIQHGGVLLGIGGVAAHDHRLSDRASPGYFGKLQLAHRLSAVTAACMVVRREAWDAVAGFDEVNLPVAYNDVDFCLRLRSAGWDVVFTPHARLIHHESISRGPESEAARADEFAREATFMKVRWGTALRRDPYYNPNLTLDADNYSLAWPPRVPLSPELH